MADSLRKVEELPWESHVSELLIDTVALSSSGQPSKIRIDYASGDIETQTCATGLRRTWRVWRHACHLFPAFAAIARQDRTTRPVVFWLSFASVAFVVGLCAVLVTLVASLPVVFLNLSQIENGQVDLTLSPGGTAVRSASLNYSLAVAQLTQLVAAGALTDVYRQVFPSIHWTASAYPLARCNGVTSARDLWYLPSPLAEKVAGTGATDTADLVCRQGCLRSRCGNEAGPHVAVVAVDPVRVDGKLFTTDDGSDPLSELNENGGLIEVKANDAGVHRVIGAAVLNENVAAHLGVHVGDHIALSGDVEDSLRGIVPAEVLTVGDWRSGHTLVEVRVVGTVSSSYAEKFMGSDEWLVVHYDAIPSLIAASVSPVIPPKQAARIAHADARSAAHALHFTMPREVRDNAYFRSGYKPMRDRVAAWSAPLISALGASQLHVSAPVLAFMSTLDYFSMFLGLVMGVLVIVFAVLSTLLNYSLLTMSLERRRYEIGVQRMIGFTRTDVASLVLTQSYMYTVPAWLVGIVGGQLFHFILRLLLQWLTGVSLKAWLTWRAIGFSTALAMLIPLIAAVFPIRSLLLDRLTEALDTTRGTETSGVRYQIKSPANEMRRRSYTLGGLGCAFAVLGISVYYLLPLSLLRMDLSTLFTIFFAVLLGMICGLVLLTSNVDFIVQYIVAKGLLSWWESRSVVQCTLKNLTAHRLRNRRTTLLYTLSVSLAIFLTVMLNINFDMLKFTQYRNMGSCLTARFHHSAVPLGRTDVLVTAATPETTLLRRMRESALTVSWTSNATGTIAHFVEYALDGAEERASPAFLDDFAAVETLLEPLLKDGTVMGVTYRLTSVQKGIPTAIARTAESTFGRYAQASREVNLLPPNAFDVLDNRFVIVRDTSGDQAERFGLGASLYAAESAHKAVIATTLYRHLALESVNDTFLFSAHFSSAGLAGLDDTREWPQIRHSVVSPAAVMDSSPVFFMTRFPNSLGDVLTSVPVGLTLSATPYLSSERLPLVALHIRLANNDDASTIKNAVRALLDARNVYTTWTDPNSSVKDIKTAFLFLSSLLIFAQVMIYIVCFFSLLSSTTSNVLSSSKEIGILLALGMQHKALYRTFIWEALTLILSSGFLGACIGLVMAYTIQIQNSLLNQISMPFTFAGHELLMLIIVGLVSALVASYSPVRFLLSLPSTSSILAFN